MKERTQPIDTYVIGCDYGTLSMRTLLVRTADGAVAAEEVFAYPHGVISDCLPGSGVKLEGSDWALQDPDDYILALRHCIPAVIQRAAISPADVIAIGVDFTTCTVMPLAQDGTPMCKLEAYRARPHAWVKLWKNHTAHQEADEITDYVHAHGYKVLDSYGNRASSEWFFPKIWEILRKDAEVYEQCHTFIEGGDYVVYQLCGSIVRSGVFAAAKGFYDNEKGCYPDPAFFRGLDPRLEHIVEEKHLTNIARVGAPAGRLTPEMAQALGLHEDVVICVAHADAACTLPGAGIAEPNSMTYVMGTSTCHMMMSETLAKLPGICAAYYDGIIPGYYCYEAGQNAVGDIFDWFCKHYLPQAYTQEACHRGIHSMELMNEKAAVLRPGESGLMALDWMNGNRSILQDANLTGLLIGLTLSTKPEEIYRALLEATAFGTRVIMDTFAASGIRIDQVYACGGLAQKNPLIMQIYSDVMGLPIKVSAVKQTSAMASALFAAVAAGSGKGGYDAYTEAIAAMIPAPRHMYKPIPENVEKYNTLFKIYKQLHDTMSAPENNAMKQLRALQREVTTGSQR